MGEKAHLTPGLVIPRDPTTACPGRIKLQRILDRLGERAPVVLTAEAQQEFEPLYRKFKERRFYLAFLGQFKRGKTTLLNCLLGADLLPTGVLPLTSIVTIVRYGAREYARVNFTDRNSREIAVDRLPAYVTERGNPRNRKRVMEVEVFHPAPSLADGLCLVDTPGIGSIFEHNTQVAYQSVLRADAGIFIFSPESPLSQTELEFLHHLRAHVEKIFFVLNKADQVNDAERAEILEFARLAIRERMPAGELRVFPVSARQGLIAQENSDPSALEASRVSQLVQALDQFLSTHKGDVLVRSTAAALRRLVRDQILGLELEERALTMDNAQLEAKIHTIEQTWQSLGQRHREAGYVLRGEMRAFESDLENRLNRFVEGEASRLVKRMRDKVQQYPRASNRELARILDRELRQEIAETLEEWKIEEEKAVQEVFELLTSRFSTEAASVVAQIQQAAAEQFGFSWTATPLPDRLATESRFSIKVDEVVTWGLGQFPLLLPTRLFAQYLANRMERICLEELYRNAGRLKADLGDRLEDSVNTYLHALDRHVEGARDSVRAALRRAAAVKESSDTRTREVTEKRSLRLAFLRSVDEELSSLQAESEQQAL